MSAMLPDDEPVQTLGAKTSRDAENQGNDGAAANTLWIYRWVNIEPSQAPILARGLDTVQVTPPPIIERRPEPILTPRDVILVCITIVLTLGTIEVLFRRNGQSQRT